MILVLCLTGVDIPSVWWQHELAALTWWWFVATDFISMSPLTSHDEAEWDCGVSCFAGWTWVVKCIRWLAMLSGDFTLFLWQSSIRFSVCSFVFFDKHYLLISSTLCSSYMKRSKWYHRYWHCYESMVH